MPVWIKTFLGLILFLGLGACATENVHRAPESAQMVLLRIIAASGDNSCAHIMRISDVKTSDMTEGTIVFLSMFQASRIYQNHKKHCFDMINEEMKRLGLRYGKSRG